MRNKKERPDLPDKILVGIETEAEDFQNKVLRPVIKMQSDILVAHLEAKLVSLKTDLALLSKVKQQETLTKLFSKDQSFKREIIGVIIGQFTLEEYNQYLKINKNKEVNQRINQIVLNRCLDLVV